MDLFFKDSLTDLSVTWDQLIAELSETETYASWCSSTSCYEVFKQIIRSLLLEKPVILADADDTNQELPVPEYHEESCRISGLTNKSELLHRLNGLHPGWTITLFTSGTTGSPKKVSHSFESITRFVKVSAKHTGDVWGFAYHPAHMAGIQVFFQALLNGNPVIRLSGLPKEQMYEEIRISGITHISATPTFYRLMLPFDATFPAVKGITSGGEKFDKQTIRQLSRIFPEARITNVYASTEAGTLFAADGDTFSVSPEISDRIKFENNELLIHTSLTGNRGTPDQEWYHTGDLVEIVSENPTRFRFVSRNNEMINVGGFKVNPQEVEEMMRTIPGIEDARIFAKNNSVLGNIICSEVVRTDDGLDEASIR
ncbi:MAG TPA: AMP-binding protein, partial [Bacteroidales bacterium]|nr:AMP-binding protein [Bacteroidales bacterium]